MELVNFYFFCHLFSYFVRLLRIPYTLSGMNMIMIMTVLMMISFPHAKNAKNAAIRGHVSLHEDVWSNVSPIL